MKYNQQYPLILGGAPLLQTTHPVGVHLLQLYILEHVTHSPNSA